MTGYITLAHLLPTLTSSHPQPFSLLPPTLLRVILQAALRREFLVTLVTREHHLLIRLFVHPLHVDCQPRLHERSDTSSHLGMIKVVCGEYICISTHELRDILLINL